uniref:Nucleoporin NUP53 n=1 Tax=Strigamia maritima TaxID=126957 RepID=T1J9E2_STRMM
MFSGAVDSAGSPTGEPMNLGSPVGSPNNPPGTYGSPQYLPSFLIGEPTGSPMNNSRLWNSPGPGTSQSPQKSRPIGQIAHGLPTTPSKALFSPIAANTSISRTYARPTPTDKNGGPPIQGLFEYSTPTSARTSLVGGSVSPPQFKNNSSFYVSTTTTPAKVDTMVGHEHPGKSFSYAQSPAQIDPFYTQGQCLTSNDQLDETWVTIFGFPPAASSYILQQFYHYGTIVEHRLPPSGNWMHVRYQTKLQAKIALSKNGKVFGNYMVGVKPCIDKSIIVQYVSKMPTKEMESPNASRILQNGNQSPFASADFSVINPGHMPQKRVGIFSKAKELLFNW